MNRKLLFPLFVLVALLAGCAPQAATVDPTATGLPTIEVTRVVLEAGVATSTPAICSPLPEGMELVVEPVSPERATIQVSGLRPGEYLTILFIPRPTATEAGQTELSLANPIGPDGMWTYQMSGLHALSGATENVWTIKVIHARGVACREIVLP